MLVLIPSITNSSSARIARMSAISRVGAVTMSLAISES